MDEFALTARERKQLERILHRTCNVRVYRRTLAILEVSQGTSVGGVARMLGVSRQSIYNWLAQYDPSNSVGSLGDHPRSGRPSLWTDRREVWLRNLMRVRPEARGYFANTWTVPLLKEELLHCTGQSLSQDTIRRGLRRLGYVWKRTRYVLLPDPEREKKTPNLPGNIAIGAAECVAG